MIRRKSLLLLLTLLLPQALSAQSAADILDTALERHEARLANIDNYTVAQSVNGSTVTMYYEKQMRDGHPVMEARLVGAGAMPQMAGGRNYQRIESAETLTRLRDRAKLSGTEDVGDRKAWVLQVDDLSGLGFDAQEFQPRSMILHVDQQDYVPLRMTMSGQLTRNGEAHDVTMTTRMDDYRDVQGLLHPFSTSIKVEGMMDAMSPDEREQMQQQMEEMKKRLAELPPEQRAMMEQQMKRMPQMRAMMEQMSAGEGLEMTVEVVSIEVNTGPPSGN